MKLIEKTILAQTEDQYPYATVYEQECALYSFSQHSLTNEQWYERFNTKIDVGSAIGVTRQHKVLLEHTSQELHNKKFCDLPDTDQDDVREKAEERYLSYIFLRQSGKQHTKLKVDLQNDFTTGDDRYPKNRQSTLHLLDKYSKSALVTNPTTSEGTAFAQQRRIREEKDDTKKDPFDKIYWKDKECYQCHNKGHPSSHCPKKNVDDKDDKSRSSNSSKASSISKLKINQKKMKKSFATLENKIVQLENED
jgi:hypothetical protein